MSEKALVIGGGGREHALAWKLSLSPRLSHVFVAPGNAGIESDSSGRLSCVDSLNTNDHASVIAWCRKEAISMVVVGPEVPLAEGIADSLASARIACFGPSAAAARIESSKKFAKEFMERHRIPTARWQAFDDVETACQHIDDAGYPALVVKASGLAAGKGVVVAADKEEAKQAVKEIMESKKFGSAGDTVVIEEYLEGEEVSVLAFSDGQDVAVMPSSQDHKRLLDNDKGPNTGGMGAYSPCPQVSGSLVDEIRRSVLQPAVKGLSQEGSPYIGVLYAGLMLTKSGPRVLEFNCRFGDPETQAILPLLESDFYTVIKSCIEGCLLSSPPTFNSSIKYSVAVVMASGGYPDSYPKGKVITGVSKACALPGVKVFHAATVKNENRDLLTSGGRVLAVSATAESLKEAVALAYKGVDCIKFDGAYCRKDIACLGLKSVAFSGLTYEAAGVNIKAGNAFVAAIKPLANATKRLGCIGSLGGFGALFDCGKAGHKDPVLVSGTDGVGTKLKIAQACNVHSTIGIDLVAMCVNDVLAHGAEPLFFLDYFSTGKLDVEVAKSVVAGIAEGCKMAGCALTGGETAEMPDMYRPGEYDLAGFVVGACERGNHLPRLSEIAAGDCLIGLASSGIHSNGFSLVRKLVQRLGLAYDDRVQFTGVAAAEECNATLGEILLKPTRIYVRSVLPLLRGGKVKAFAHVTGGGLLDNIPRVLPDRLGACLDASKWEVQPVFGWLAKAGNVEAMEMARTFNVGLGCVLVVGDADADGVVSTLCDAGETAWKVGSVCVEGKLKIEVVNLADALQRSFASPDVLSVVRASRAPPPTEGRKKVGVLISGTGTNLQALIDNTRRPDCDYANIVLVISNVPGVEGLKRAERAGIATKVIPHKRYKSRRAFDSAVHEALLEAGVDIVCLAGFMRIVGAEFVNRWQGKLLNIHPSLLPSFRGMHAHEAVLEAGVRLSGCTVHFVEEEVDAGAIIVQEAVAVLPGDTVDTLSARVKQAEHTAYPEALKLLATGRVKRGDDGKIVWTSP